MRPSPATTSGAAHYVWRVDEKPVAVHLSLDVVNRMQALLRVTDDARTPEVGGILLGRARQVNDSWIVSVEDYEPVECEYVRGASWTLSARERKQFGRRLERLRRKGIVGWFRTHTRPGLFLDQYDFGLFAEFFSHPASVALAIRPDSQNGPEASFFFWEDGDMRRSAPYRAFRFTEGALRPSPPALAPALIPLHHAAEPARQVQPAVPRPAPPPTAVHTGASIGKKLLLATPVAAGLLAGILWHPKIFRTAPASAPAAEIARTTPVERAVFAPPGETVPEMPPAAVVTDPPEEETPVQAPPARRRTPVSATRARQFATGAPKGRPALPEPKMDVSAPELKLAANTEHPVVPPRSSPAARMTATVEPVQVSVLRKAVGSIPGLGFLKKKKNAQAFVPPKPIQQIHPSGFVLGQESEPIRVRVTVDPAGDVASAHLLSRNVEPDIARAAVDAARRWRFAPATLGEKPVSAELIVRFAPAGDRGI